MNYNETLKELIDEKALSNLKKLNLYIKKR